MASDVGRQWAWIVGLRALVMLLAGLYAVIWPGPALAVLVVAGGVLMLIDGALGLWSLTFGGAKTGNFWFDVVRNILAIICGIVILLFPLLSTLITVWFVVYLIAIQAIVVGIMELMVAFRARAMMGSIWPVLLSGILYVLFGIALALAPVMSAIFLVVLAGVMMILFSAGLFVLAFRLYRGPATA